jgi:Uma2 family endonuclease
MTLASLSADRLYTYADYMLWELEERVELIKGKIFNMSPAPSRIHQEVLGQLHLEIGTHFRRNKCSVYVAPFDVRLPKAGATADEQVQTVVQPDLCVICDKSKLDERGCLGAPDLVVEILSPGNSKKEVRQKFEVYQEAGVREYWLVNYYERMVQVFVLKESKFIGLPPVVEEDTLTSVVFPELKIDLEVIFKQN